MKMKLLLSLCLLALSGAPQQTAMAAAADSFTFSESLSEKIISYREDGEVYYDLDETISLSFNISVTIPGLDGAHLDELTEIDFSLGGFEFYASLEAADVLTENRAVFIDYSEESREIGRITFTRSGERLSIVGSHRDLMAAMIGFSPIVVSQIEEDDELGTVGGAVEFYVSVDDYLESERILYFTGKHSITTKTAGDEEYTLNSISVTGGADTTRPTLKVTSPKSGLRIGEESVIVRGTASDNYLLDGVGVSVNDGAYEDYLSFEEADEWEFELPLAPGVNEVTVYGFDGSGNFAMQKLTITRIVMDPIRITHDDGGTVAGVTDGQRLEVGKSYKVTATAGPQHLFSGWVVNGGDANPKAALTFVMEEGLELHAGFVLNPFPQLKGTYHGLFTPPEVDPDGTEPWITDSLQPTNAGAITLTVTDKGNVSGKILIAGKSVSVSGTCDLDSTLRLTFTPPGQPVTELTLAFELEDGQAWANGAIANSAWTSQANVVRAAPVTEAALLAGAHTYVIPGADAELANALPAGNGAGTLKVAAAGKITLVGNAGDGTPLTQAAPVCEGGLWPMHLPLLKGRGLILGWVRFTVEEQVQPEGQLGWIKSPNPADKLYAAGFHRPCEFATARYTVPAKGSNSLAWTGGVLLLDGGNLTATVSNQVRIAANKVTIVGENPYRIAATFAPAKGTFSGSFIHPVSGVKTPINGSVLQSADARNTVAAGWFKGSSESGYVEFNATPAP